FNAGTGGGSSNALTFTVSRDLPEVTSVTPNSAPIGEYVALRGTRLDSVNSVSWLNSPILSGTIVEPGGSYLRLRIPFSPFSYLNGPLLIVTQSGSCWCTRAGPPLNLSGYLLIDPGIVILPVIPMP